MQRLRSFIIRTTTVQKDIQFAVIVFIVLIVIGTIGYQRLEGWSLLDSLYFSVITLTTIGYGDMHPTLDATKVFTIMYVLIGVGLVFYLFTSITKHLFDDEKREIERLEKTVEHVERLLEQRKSDQTRA